MSTFERIAKKILLAQINANFSSGDDISSDDETQGDESDSDGLKEVRQREESAATDEDGKCVSSKQHTASILQWCIFLKNQGRIQFQSS